MTRKNKFFVGCCWLNINNLELALRMALKFYTNVTKELKLKVRKFLGLIPTIVEVAKENLAGDLFAPLPSWIGLTDNGKLLMVEKWFRGGLFHSVNRYAKDDKKYINNYDKKEESSFLKHSVKSYNKKVMKHVFLKLTLNILKFTWTS